MLLKEKIEFAKNVSKICNSTEDPIFPKDVYKGLYVKDSHLNGLILGKVMRLHGFENKVINVEGKYKRFWVRTEDKEINDGDIENIFLDNDVVKARELKEKLDSIDAKLDLLLVAKKKLKANHKLEEKVDKALNRFGIYDESQISSADIYIICELDRTHATGLVIAKLMREKGFTSRTIKIGGKPVRVWREAPEVQL